MQTAMTDNTYYCNQLREKTVKAYYQSYSQRDNLHRPILQLYQADQLIKEESFGARVKCMLGIPDCSRPGTMLQARLSNLILVVDQKYICLLSKMDEWWPAAAEHMLDANDYWQQEKLNCYSRDR